MTSPDHDLNEADLEPVRPVGAWVIGGFVVAVSLAIWTLVSVIFFHRT